MHLGMSTDASPLDRCVTMEMASLSFAVSVILAPAELLNGGN